MDKDEFIEWQDENWKELTEMFIEQQDDEFYEFCEDRYVNLKAGEGDMAYDRMKEDKILFANGDE